MRFSKQAAVLLAAAAAATASDVHDLKADTFNDFISSHDLVLAEFFAPWCGHCKALAPEYETAATALKEKDIPIAKIDCTEQAELCKTHGVEGYPTLKLFRGLDTVTPYNGARKSDAIVSYMTKQALPAVTELTSETLEDFKTADKLVLVGYFGTSDKSANTTFSEIANSLRDDYLLGAVSDAAVAKAEGVKPPAVVLYKSFDEGKAIHDGAFEKADVLDWVKITSTPLIGEVTPSTFQGYMSAGLPLAYIFSETQTERDSLSALIKPLAEKYKGKINIATIDAKAFGSHGGNLNLQADVWPAFAIQDIAGNKKYPMDQSSKLDATTVGDFLEQFTAGKLEPSVKSEPIPEKQDGPVTVVVAKNYNEVVKDDNKDVLLEFYAPWCGHCKNLAPKYDELGQMFSGKKLSSKVTIAKVDATANDVPDDISGFPTIKLFPAGSKGEPVTYEGDRSIADLAKFISEKGYHKINAFDANVSAPDASDADIDPEIMGKAAEAASVVASGAAGVAGGVVGGAASVAASVVGSAASEAAEVVKTMIVDTDEVHDEL